MAERLSEQSSWLPQSTPEVGVSEQPGGERPLSPAGGDMESGCDLCSEPNMNSVAADKQAKVFGYTCTCVSQSRGNDHSMSCSRVPDLNSNCEPSGHSDVKQKLSQQYPENVSHAEKKRSIEGTGNLRSCADQKGDLRMSKDCSAGAKRISTHSGGGGPVDSAVAVSCQGQCKSKGQDWGESCECDQCLLDYEDRVLKVTDEPSDNSDSSSSGGPPTKLRKREQNKV